VFNETLGDGHKCDGCDEWFCNYCWNKTSVTEINKYFDPETESDPEINPSTITYCKYCHEIGD
jgi:hypothetical protein